MSRTVTAVMAFTLGFALPAAAQPYVYAVTQDGVFRSGIHLTPLPPRLVTIDPASAQAIASLPLAPCSIPTGVAVRADGLRVFVSCTVSSINGGAGGSVLAIDPVAKQILLARTFDGAPGDVAVTPAGDRLVTSGVFGASLVLDADTLNTLGPLAAAPSGSGVFGTHQPAVVSPDGSKAYLLRSSKFSSVVSVHSLADYSFLTSIPSGEFGSDMAFSGDGTRLLVGGFNRMTIVDVATDTVVNTVALEAIRGVAANAGTRGYAARSAGIDIVDLATAAIVGQLPPALAGQLATNAARTQLYAATDSQASVAVVDLASGTTTGSAVVKGGVIDMAVPAASPAIAPDACSYTARFRSGFASPLPLQSPAGSSDWRIDVVALPDRCAWTAQSDVPWITFEYAGGTGTDNVGVTIAPNTTGVSRAGTITIGGQTLTVAQAGCTNPIVFFERPSTIAAVAQPFMVSGWGIDTCSMSGPGLEDLSAPPTGYGRARPDVAAAFGGSQFTNSGFEFRETFERRPGVQDLSYTFRSTVTGNPVTATTRANVLPSIPPFGAIDTPAERATVSGDMPLTGWVMDDVGLLGNVLIYRDSLPGEGSSPGTPGKLFVGVATRVAGARPDVQALFPNYADNDRAGFGAMILTNALPNGGNGTFTFHVQVADRYNAVWLGVPPAPREPAGTGPRGVTVTVDNASSPLPFGAVDTPAPGQTVSGTITLWGWALTPGTSMIPLDGSTIDVLIDGVFVGHPTYNLARPDVQALFPGYTNSAAPGGYLNFDTRTLSNGLHTIAWVVRDNAGNAKGIGSRFFTVNNP